MVLLNRSIMASFIILLSLISVAYGDLKISASTGDASGSSSYTESLGAEINDQIHESTALSGSSLSQSFDGFGNRAETFSVTNRAGDHAEVGFDIKNSEKYSGSYTLSPETAYYAKATEKLNVNIADYIHAFSSANSRDGNSAGLGVDVTKGSLIGYANSAYATSGDAKAIQSWSEASGDVVNLGGGANNLEGNTARAIIDNGDLDGTIGSIYGYSSTVEAKKSKVSATQNAKTIQGNYYIDAIGQNQLHNSAGTFAAIRGTTTDHISAATATKSKTDAKFSAKKITGSGSIWTNAYIDYFSPDVVTSVNTNWENGEIRGYSNEAKTQIHKPDFTDIIGSQQTAFASGDVIRTSSNAQGLENCRSFTRTETISGTLQKYSDDAKALKPSLTNNVAETSVALTASGSEVDVYSSAENTKNAYEHGHGDTGEIVQHGGAEFEVQAKALVNTKVKSTSTNDDVNIDPKLSSSIRTAIMLEPFDHDKLGYYADYRETIFPILVSNGFAVLSYTDSGASLDKFKKLDKYNLVLISSHMGPDAIDLSSSPFKVTAKNLDSWYNKPPKNSFVLLDGCSSFAGYPSELSPLADSVKEAGISGGYERDVGMHWTTDSMSELFRLMDTGLTARQASEIVSTTYREEWIEARMAEYPSIQRSVFEDQAVPLSLYGKKDFQL